LDRQGYSDTPTYRNDAAIRHSSSVDAVDRSPAACVPTRHSKPDPATARSLRGARLGGGHAYTRCDSRLTSPEFSHIATTRYRRGTCRECRCPTPPWAAAVGGDGDAWDRGVPPHAARKQRCPHRRDCAEYPRLRYRSLDARQLLRSDPVSATPVLVR